MKKQNKKKIIITVTAVVLVVAIGLGVWFGVSRGRSEPVKVFAFNSVGMTEYWGDSQESYGPVSTDKIQTVFLSSTQTVTEMKVAQGDEVKKGDVLMTFDTTLSDLQLERKRLEVEKLKLDLETAQKKLKDIRNMKPMSIVSSDDFDYGGENGGANRPLEGNYELSDKQFYDGKDEETALICWLRNGYTVNDSILEKARQLAEDLQTKNQPDPTEPDTEPTTEPTTEPPTQPSTEPPTQPSTEPPTQPSTEPPTQPSTEASTPSTEESSEGEDGEQSSASAAENPGEKPTVSVEDYYIVFKVTKDDMSMGNRLAWEGLHVFKQGSGFAFNFFDASGVPDHTITTDDPDNPDEPDDPDIPDPGSGYTAAQLARDARRAGEDHQGNEIQDQDGRGGLQDHADRNERRQRLCRI
ncbi:MAG: biotin/lipoyl-binding protein [Oscillospiraceae bacterium]